MSSLVRSQMVAAMVSLILSLMFIVAGFWRPEMDPSNFLYRIIYYVSVPLQFSHDFTQGVGVLKYRTHRSLREHDLILLVPDGAQPGSAPPVVMDSWSERPSEPERSS